MSDVPNTAKPVSLPIRDDSPQGFLVSSAPHLASGATTQRIMFEVVLAMVPLLVMGVVFFGMAAITLTVLAVAGCLIAEAIANWMRGRSQSSLADGSAIVTGMILAFSLPASMARGGTVVIGVTAAAVVACLLAGLIIRAVGARPSVVSTILMAITLVVAAGCVGVFSVWIDARAYMALIGGIVAIALAKAVFGGIGHNLFNPAMVGRAFLMICFPAAMAAWTPTVSMMPKAKADEAAEKDIKVSQLTREDIDAITTATPLYQAAKVGEYVRQAAKLPEDRDKSLAAAQQIRDQMPTLWRLVYGDVPGCVGETSALVALICGMWLVLRRVADWRQPLALLVTVALFALITNLIDPARFQGPLYHLTSGALMFGAFFIATDYVGAPVNPWGRLVFGAGVGLLVMVIRLFGAYPEGVMFAILIMNALTPVVERATTPTPFGGHVAA
jgi:electron transport complex protein RnfD